MKKEIIVNSLVSTISIAISASFILFGYSMLYEDAPNDLIIFGAGTIIYGLVGIACLIVAWIKNQNYSQNILLFLSFLIVVAYLIASTDVGMISGLEWFGIVVIAIISFSNWYIVRKIAKFKMEA